MLKMSRLTDYGTMVLAYMAASREPLLSAADVAEGTHLGPATVSKLLKALARAELVTSVRGAHGGYILALEPSKISAAQIIDALEGPVALTECSVDDNHCALESVCHVGNAWQRVNAAIRLALDEISLSQLIAAGRGELPKVDLRSAVSDSVHVKN